MRRRSEVWKYHDGGRVDAGYRGEAGDCVVRAISIAAQVPYQEIYDTLNTFAQSERPRGRKRKSSSRTGVYRRTYERYLASLGFVWTPTMAIGSGCKVHLRSDELPPGRLVVAVSRHLCAVVDGVVLDTSDPTRDGTRCVYGYYARDPRTAQIAASLDQPCRNVLMWSEPGRACANPAVLDEMHRMGLCEARTSSDQLGCALSSLGLGVAALVRAEDTARMSQGSSPVTP